MEVRRVEALVEVIVPAHEPFAQPHACRTSPSEPAIPPIWLPIAVDPGQDAVKLPARLAIAVEIPLHCIDDQRDELVAESRQCGHLLGPFEFRLGLQWLV